ncbi:MAG: type I methionyl aminopeptidase [Bacteroidetes bacterium]|nr:MAG: type I methionyl aminopeptidase [Bacteroidota bacterium]
MIDYKTEEEIEVQRKSSLLVGKTLAEVAKLIEPGITTLKLDKVAEEFIRDNNAIPGFKDYNGFPNTLCTSVNDQVVHGIPSDKPLKEGDIVSVDCGVLFEGFYGDSAYTFAIGEISEEIQQLLDVTKKSLLLGLEKAVVGNRVGDIGYTIQQYTESFGYGVVRELVGHGVGKNLHESPEVPNYGRKKSGLKLKQGLVLAIEPMINLGTREVNQLKDGWTIVTADGKPSAHFEHDVAVKRGKVDVLSTFEYIEEVLKNK